MSLESSSLDIKLKRHDRTYRPNELVQGTLLVSAFKGWSHNGINMVVEGAVYLSHTNRGSVGVSPETHRQFPILRHDILITSPGQCPPGISQYPFQFTIQALPDQALYESYHGVHLSVIYKITAVCDRGVMKKALVKELEMIIEIPSPQLGANDAATDSLITEPKPATFTLTPESLDNVSSKVISSLPKFQITGTLFATNCNIETPLNGEIVIDSAEAPIKVVELQLIRVETITLDGKTTTNSTEVETLQIGQGDVCRGFGIPLYMQWPRLYCCPSAEKVGQFKVSFEVNLAIIYADDYIITENFPVTLYRGASTRFNSDF